MGGTMEGEREVICGMIEGDGELWNALCPISEW